MRQRNSAMSRVKLENAETLLSPDSGRFMSALPSRPFVPRLARKNAFTLVEILVVTGISALLVALALGGYRQAIDRGRQMKEFAAGRTLISAYLQYAADHDGNLMVAQYEGSSPEVDNQQVIMPDGTRLDGGSLHRYPFRLAQYFDYQINDVILVNENRKQVSQSFAGSMHTYGTSLCPSFGINYYFVGGYKVDNEYSAEQLRETAFRVSQVDKPSSLLVFATAFTPDVAGRQIDGRFGVEPPAYRTALWDANLHVDPRHNGRVLCAFMDGSLRTKTVDELRDMRLWSKLAQQSDNPDYRVAATGSGGIGGGGGGRR